MTLDSEARSFIYALLGADTWIEAGAIWEGNPEQRKAAHVALADAYPDADFAFTLKPMDTAPSGDEAMEPSEIDVHEGAWAVVMGTNAKPIGWIDTHALFEGRTYRDRLTAALSIRQGGVKAEPVCETCNGTGNEGRHSICRDCDGLSSPAQEIADKPSAVSVGDGVWNALVNLVAAWESTEPGTTTKGEIQRWLVEDMKPAIDFAREALKAAQERK